MRDERTGEDLVSIGFVVDLDYADATTSPHDLLQLFKQHPLVRGILDGGERVDWGAKALPGGGWWSMPQARRCRARCIVGDAGGLVDTVSLKGVHHAITLGPARRRGDLRGAGALERIVRVLRTGARAARPRRSSCTACATRASHSSAASSAGAPLVNLAIATRGRLPPGRLRWQRDDERAMFVGEQLAPLPQARRPLHLRQALVGLRQRQRHPRRRAQPHPRAAPACRASWPRPGGGCARPGYTRSPTDAPTHGDVDVIVNYTNCVQCGAITAKGGRLTPPEGGDGPLYRQT